MSIEFKLFVHGVPKGQKIWGPNEQDRDYIGLSYGKYRDKPNHVLSVEINGSNSYYTYFVGQNVLAKDGRPGSYFAITLRINRYYADVKNIYNQFKEIEIYQRKAIIENINLSFASEI